MLHKSTRYFLVMVLVSGLVALHAPTPARAAGPWYVATTGDDGNNCLGPATPCASINGAIGKAAPLDTIYVAVGTYTAPGPEVVHIDRDITLSGGWDVTFTTQIGTSTTDGQASSRGLTVNNGVTASVDRFTFQNGNVTGGGGGIQNSGNLTVDHTVISNNSAGNGGGAGIYNTDSGVLVLNNSTVSHNGSTQLCWTIENHGVFIMTNSVIEENTTTTIYCAQLTVMNASGTMSITDSVIRNNLGGVYNYAGLVLNSSVIHGNVATGDGPGGIYNWGGSLTVNNSTISGNSTTNGGGLFAGGGAVVRFNNSTITNNTANMGGGLYNYPNAPAQIILQNTIVAGNNVFDSRPDCSGNIDSAGYNLVGSITGCFFNAATGDLTDTDSSLGPLQDNGGPTFTHALLPQSAAINAGNPSGCTDQNGDPFVTDQRGISRPQGLACDIGAYEYVFSTPGPATSIAIISGNNQLTRLNSAFSKPLRVVALDGVGNRVSGVTITFTAPASGASGTFTDSGNNITLADTDAGGIATSSTFTSNNIVGAYSVLASAAGLGTVEFSLEQFDRPANDNFVDAIVVDSLPFSATLVTTEATVEFGEQQWCVPMDKTVWYTFTLAESTVIQIDGIGSSVDANINIYQPVGPGINGLNIVGCTGLANEATFLAQGGQTYYIQAGPFSGQDGTIQINLNEVPPPPNDDFAAATPVGTLPSTLELDTASGSLESDEPIPSCAMSSPPTSTVWFAFTPTQDQTASVSLFNNTFNPFWAVYSGSSLNNLTEIGCRNFDRLSFHAAVGNTYYIQVGGLNGSFGTALLQTEVAPAPAANYFYFPFDPNKFDTIQFMDSSSDPANLGIQSWNWNFGDGTSASISSPSHRFAADGDYQVTLSVTTVDGRTNSTTQTVQVRTHDVAITRISAPNSANTGQTKTISVTLRNRTYAETVQVDLYKSVPGGFQWVATVTRTVPALSGNRTTSVSFNYTFTSDDARLGKVTFKVVATLLGARDALPVDNEAISSPPTKVGR